MTTRADVKNAVESLLAAHDDLLLIGRLVAIKPISHILKGIYLDRSSSRDDFVVRWAAIFLFEPRSSFMMSWGAYVYCPTPGLWTKQTPELQTLLKTSIEREALPALRPVRTIAEFSDYASVQRIGGPLQNFPLSRIVVDAALGRFEACDRILDDLDNRRLKPASPDEDELRITRDLAPLIRARDRAGVAALLHEWEAWSVKAMKLEKYWERTPFPVEMA